MSFLSYSLKAIIMTQTQAEANVTLFKNSHGNIQIALYSGTLVAFLLDPESNQGRFFTSNKKIERELMAAVENENEFGVYIDPAEPVIDLNAATPMEQLEKKIRAKLMAELQAGGKLVDAGTSVVSQAQLQQAMANTTSVPGASQTEEELALQAQQLAASQSAPAPVLIGSNGQVVTQETVQPEGANTPALSALEKLKAAQQS